MGSEESIMSHADGTALRSSLSFELFPPKDKAGIDRLISGTVKRLAAFRPDYFSVTFGAGGSTGEGTSLSRTTRSFRNRGGSAPFGRRAVPARKWTAWLNTIETWGFSESSACGETNLPAATSAPYLQKIWSSSCISAFPTNSS